MGDLQSNSKQEIGNKESDGDQTSEGNEDDGEGAVAECSHCLLSTSNDRRVMCDICRQYLHQKCTGMNAKIFDKFITHVEITGWVCDDCKTAARQSHQRLAAAVAHLAEQIASLKQEMAAIGGATVVTDQGALASVRVQQPGSDAILENNSKTNATATMLIVQKTINDAARRKRNVVITGLPERSDGDDKSAFLSLCEEQLPMKPMVAEKDCIRLGKKFPDKPRRLLVRLDSEDTAANLLRAAPMLRNSTDQDVAHNVYINPDLSPAASQLAYEARRARRESVARRGRTPTDNAARTSTQTGATIPSIPSNQVGVPSQPTASQSFRGN
jgi:predicted metal-binding protein